MKAICIALLAALSFAGTTPRLLAATAEKDKATLEKEKADFEKQKAAFDKEKAAFDQEKSAAEGKTKMLARFKALAGKIQAKVNAGKSEEADYKEELKEWDSMIADQKNTKGGDKSNELGELLQAKAMFYVEILNNTDMALKIAKQLKDELPDTDAGMNAPRMINMITKQEEAKKIQAKLAVGAEFPDFDEKDLDDKPLSVANYKGKVVLVDFWATWCQPCMMEMPNVIAAYEKYHDKGFEIIGIDMEQNVDKAGIAAFLKKNNMPWQQYLDGGAFQTKLAVKYGIMSIPSSFLVGKDGKIIAKNLRGDDLEKAVAKGLGL